MSDFLLRELDRIATRPSRAELLELIASRAVATLEPASEVLAERRPSRWNLSDEPIGKISS